MLMRRFPCVRQHDATDCGAACLATVARHYGRRVSLTRIRECAGTDGRGTNILGMLEAARRLGFEARGVKAGLDALAGVPLPAIAHVLRGALPHFVVVHRVTPRHVVVADPARGVVRSTHGQFASIWTGVLVLLTAGRDFPPADFAASPPLRQRLFRLVRPHGKLLAGAFAAAFLFTLLGMSTSVFLQFLVDRVVLAHNAQLLAGMTVLVAALALLRAGSGWLRGALLARIGQRVDAALMLGYLRHVLRLPVHFFATRPAGEVLERFADAVKVRDVIGGTAVVLLVDAATTLAGFAFLFYYSRRLASISLALWFLALLAGGAGNRALRRAQRRTMERAADVQSALVEALGGVGTVKALGAEDAIYGKVEQRIRLFLDELLHGTIVAVSAATAGDAAASVGAVCVLAAGGAAALRGQLSAGEVVAFHSILISMLQPLQRLLAMNQAIQNACVAAERLDEIQALAPEGEHGGTRCPPDRPALIQFADVGFRYGMRAPVLSGVNLTIRPNALVALVGPTGSGKSTLAKLLLRFYEPCSGDIAVGGCVLGRFDLQGWRRHVACVAQDPFVFSGTVLDNLRLANPEAPAAAMSRALQAAGFPGTEEDLNRHVGERGAALSGGERQQLAIAQALLRGPRVLILDDATGNLDSQLRTRVFETLHRLRRDMTIIVIGHRLGAGLDPDQVVVLDSGRVLEQGSPAELVRAHGHYYRMGLCGSDAR